MTDITLKYQQEVYIRTADNNNSRLLKTNTWRRNNGKSISDTHCCQRRRLFDVHINTEILVSTRNLLQTTTVVNVNLT